MVAGKPSWASGLSELELLSVMHHGLTSGADAVLLTPWKLPP